MEAPGLEWSLAGGGAGPACTFGISLDAKGVGQPAVSAVMRAFQPSSLAELLRVQPESGVAREAQMAALPSTPTRGHQRAAPEAPPARLQREVLRPQPCCPVGDANVALSAVPQRTQALQAQASSPEQGRG